MNCPRCGRGQPANSDTGAFCAYCGQFLVPMQWVAAPPGGYPPAKPPRERYTGPPRYSDVPKWGFPAQPWTPENRKDEPRQPAAAAARHAALLVPLLRGLGMFAALAAVAELWRYTLLLRSRDSALAAGEVAASDWLEVASSLVSTVMSVAAGAYLLFWLLQVIEAAAEQAGVRPSRSTRAVLAGWLVPGLNLTVPGSVLAEVEHTALGRPASERPRPSQLLRLWWLLWAGNVAFGVLAVVWMLRSGVQAEADGVTLHALVDGLASAVAFVSARLVAWLTALVNPPREIQLPTVLAVRATGEPRDQQQRDRLSRSSSTVREGRSLPLA